MKTNWKEIVGSAIGLALILAVCWMWFIVLIPALVSEQAVSTGVVYRLLDISCTTPTPPEKRK